MFVRTHGKKMAALVAVLLLSVAGCAQPAHPDRSPTTDDVKAGTACVQAPVSVIVWKETNREYVGKDGWCKYKN